MQNNLNIRSFTWFKDNLSWAYVMYSLINAFDRLGHNTFVVSTNGINENFFDDKKKMLKSIIGLQSFGIGRKQIDIDITYTVPINFEKRFLSNSKNKCAIYNYETTIWPSNWKSFYKFSDFYFPSSNFSAEIFYLNGVPKEKIFVIPHGVDTSVFNNSIEKVKLKTNKKFKFVSIVAPHARKNIPAMLEAYCRAFSDKDDVCLVLKTKVFKQSDGIKDINKNPNGRQQFEIVLEDVFNELKKKYGSEMPEIELLQCNVENVSSIYNACDCHVTTTGAEGFFMPGLEAMACGLINIVPNYSGHLDYCNSENCLLADTKLRNAHITEQYWGYNKNGKIGQVDTNHFSELMRVAFEKKDVLIDKFSENMKKTVEKFSWENAAKLIIDAVNKDSGHYVPKTFDFGNYGILK